MRTYQVMALLAGLALVAGCQNKGGSAPAAPTATGGSGAAAAAPGELPTDDAKILYALGLDIGRNIEVFALTPAELETVKLGLTDQLTGAKPKVELEVWGPKIAEFARGRDIARTEQEKKKSEAYLTKMAAEPGAQKTPSGLIYFETQAGTGAAPTASDTVKVNYKGTLIDGTEFDSSYKRNEPAEFPLGGVIPCWSEGIQKMKVGGKGKLICPAALAYGDGGFPPKIKGGAALTFEVELLEVKKTAPAGAEGATGDPAAAPAPGAPTEQPAQPAPAQPAAPTNP